MRNLLHIIRSHCTHLDPRPTGLAPRLHSLDGIKAVLFDVYGTLFISGAGDISLSKLEQCKHVLPWALEQMGVTTTVPASKIAEEFLETIKLHHGHQQERGIEHPEVEIRAVWRDLLEGISGKEPSAGDVEPLALLYEVRANPVWPMPGLDGIPGVLRERNLRSGIISNAQFYTPLLFEALLGHSPQALGFDPEYSAWSFEQLEAKPSTRLYEICADALQEKAAIAPHEILYLGNDMRNDILPASQTGFRTGLFAGDARSLRLREEDPSCNGLEPDIVLTDLRQLADCLPVG